MGLFSWVCEHCAHSLLSSPATTAGINEWMSQAVVITPKGDFHSGEYDGYGHIGGSGWEEWDGGTVYHRACWEVDGKPLDFKGASESAEDQGWFFDDGAHDLADPRSMSPGQFAAACTDLIFREENRGKDECLRCGTLVNENEMDDGYCLDCYDEAHEIDEEEEAWA